ncbi:MAG: MMPL family transporter [Lachnospiraceae bacterium]|nr:MMPL family transporter [Lachnospiraceae bacterium]
MKRFSRGIVKCRYLILVLGLALLIPSAWGYFNTRVNYDILSYLPDDIETMEGQEILQKEFGTGAFSMLVVEGMDFKSAASLKSQIEKVDYVKNVIWYDSIADLSVPVEILPKEIQDVFLNGDDTLMVVMYSSSMSSDETMEAIEDIRSLAKKECFVSGMSAVVTDTRNLANRETPVYVLIAVILSSIVLALTMDSYIIPLFFLLSIGIAIVYNLGSNIFMGQISYVTKALAAVLQLGVTMDYSIFLWHSYEEQQGICHDDKEAMANAIEMTFSSVIGSSITTIAGFIALCFMSFTLGMDLGIVMAKGVILGVICCITILPSMILVFHKLIERTKHRSLIPDFSIAGFITKHYKLIAVLFVILWIPAIYGYSHTDVYYNLDSTLPEELPSIQANKKLNENFSMGTVHVVLADSGMSAKDGARMCDEMKQVKGVQSVLGLDSLVGPGLAREMIPDDLLSDIKTDKYQLLMVTSEYAVASDEVNQQCDELETVIKKYDKEGMLIGEAPCTRDLIRITNTDFARVNAVSIGVIFAIILLVLGSISLPAILVFVIEFAVFLNMGIPCYTGTVLPFIASIVIGTIQLGSTVDYAILMTNRYKRGRNSGLGKKQAVIEAHTASMRSIIVSAFSFFAATFGVGMYSDIDMISSLCTLMARGAIISMVTVLLVLPAMLMIFDKLICFTTMGIRRK